MAQLPVENLYDPMGNATGLPVEQPSVPVQMPTQTSSVVDQIINKLFRDDEKRYQLWPEKIVRDALDAPNAAMTGRMPMYQVVDGELRTSLEAIKGALDMSALAGTGGLGGADASLGSTPFLRPALKYGEKIYKGKPGQQHLDVLPQELVPEFQKLAMSGEDISKYNFGFMNHKGQFLDREAALKYAIDEGLMSPHDAKFGALTSTMFADSSKPAVALKAAEPFFSAVEKTVQGISQGKMTGEQWLGTLSNKPGVKPEELDWTGLKSYLEQNKGQPVTKAQIEQHLANNAVKVNEVWKGKPALHAAEKEFDAATKDGIPWGKGKLYSDEVKRGLLNEDLGVADLPANLQPLAENLLKANKESVPTKYHSYQLPGGENYRELLMTLPQKSLTEAEARQVLGAKPDAKLSPADIEYASRKQAQEYKSSHWDEPNILAHVRMNDRMIGDKKSLHLEEIQSDWHQQGRDKGYRPENEKRMAELVAKRDSMIKEVQDKMLSPLNERYKEIYKELPTIQSEINKLGSGDVGVPDAPFKKNWHDLALKRAVREAAEKGYDRLSWTPGEAQAARYDLSKSIDKIKYNPDTHHVIAFDKNGNQVISQLNVEPKDLSNIVGKEVAEKIMKAEVKDKLIGGTYKVLENADLKIGGEGMKGFYDQIIPKAVEKLTGQKVQKGEIDKAKPYVDQFGKTKHDPMEIHYIEITPELKQKAMQGFPLFSDSSIPSWIVKNGELVKEE